MSQFVFQLTIIYSKNTYFNSYFSQADNPEQSINFLIFFLLVQNSCMDASRRPVENGYLNGHESFRDADNLTLFITLIDYFNESTQQTYIHPLTLAFRNSRIEFNHTGVFIIVSKSIKYTICIVFDAYPHIYDIYFVSHLWFTEKVKVKRHVVFFLTPMIIQRSTLL